MADAPRWVLDTTCYTHLCRAGHAEILERLAPGGVVVVPDDVDREIRIGQRLHATIPSVSSVPWAEVTELTDRENLTKLRVKAQLGGGPHDHLGECAVIACAHHRGHVAILDDRAATEQARLLRVPCHGTLWIVIEAHRSGILVDGEHTAGVVDDLISTGMYLPLESGARLLTWAYTEGLLP